MLIIFSVEDLIDVSNGVISQSDRIILPSYLIGLGAFYSYRSIRFLQKVNANNNKVMEQGEDTIYQLKQNSSDGQYGERK